MSRRTGRPDDQPTATNQLSNLPPNTSSQPPTKLTRAPPPSTQVRPAPWPACRSRGGSPGRSTGVRFLRYVSVVRRARVWGDRGARRTRNGSWWDVEARREPEAPKGAEPLRGRRGRPRTGELAGWMEKVEI